MLNKSFRVIWSRVKSCFVVASEISKSAQKSKSSLASVAVVGALLASFSSLASADLNFLNPNFAVGATQDVGLTSYNANEANVIGALLATEHYTAGTPPVLTGYGYFSSTHGQSITLVPFSASADAIANGDANAYGIYVYGPLVGTVTSSATFSATASANTGDSRAYGATVSGDLSGAFNNQAPGVMNVTSSSVSGDSLATLLHVGGSLASGGELSNAAVLTATSTSTNGDAIAMGVNVDGYVAGTLLNTGNVSVTSAAGDMALAYGVKVAGSLTGSIENQAAINVTSNGVDAKAYGVSVGELSGTLINVGSITSGATGTTGDAAAYGVKVNGALTNVPANSGLQNSGVISATASTLTGDAKAYGVKVAGDVTGSINNAALGVISADSSSTSGTATAAAIKVSGNVSGNIVNAGGLIATASGTEASSYGVNITGDVSATGSVTNSSSVISIAHATEDGANAYGVKVGGHLDGSITNDAGFVGALAIAELGDAASYGVKVSGDLSGAINNSGIIGAGAVAAGDASAYGIKVSGDVTTTGNMTNSGLLIAAAGAGGDATATALQVSGDVNNAGLTNTGGMVAISVSGLPTSSAPSFDPSTLITPNANTASIINPMAVLTPSALPTISGLLSSLTVADANASGISVGGNVAGSITNGDGTASALVAAVAVAGGDAQSYGIKVGENLAGGLNNQANAYIVAASLANGEATAYGVKVGGDLGSTAGVALANNGLVAGLALANGEATAYGVKVGENITGDVNNTNGLILAIASGGTDASAYGISVEGTLTGSLNNNGTGLVGIGAISNALAGEAEAYGVKVAEDLTGSINNINGATISTSANAEGGDASAYGIKVGGSLGTLGTTVTALTNDSTSAISASATSTTNDASAYAVKVGGDVNGSILNAGTVAVDASALSGEAKAYGIKVGGSVTGDITNTGNIGGTATSAIYATGQEASAYGVKVGGMLTGNLTNIGQVLVQADASAGDAKSYGVKVGEDMTGSIGNSGVVWSIANATDGDASAYGIKVGSNLNGNLTNQSYLVSYANSTAGDAKAYGVKVGGDVTGSITNLAGSVLANAAAIEGGDASAYGINVEVSLGIGLADASGLTNTNSVQAVSYSETNDASAYGVKVGVDVYAGITNAGTVSAEAIGANEATAYGIKVGVNVNGDIANPGKIIATANGDEAQATAISVGGTLNGNLTNTGVNGVNTDLEKTRAGLYANATSGTQDATASAVHVGADLAGIVTNAEGSQIQAAAFSDSGNATAHGFNIEGILGNARAGTTVFTNNGSIIANATSTTGDATAYGLKAGALAGDIVNNHLIKGYAASATGNYIGYSVYIGDPTDAMTLTNSTAGTLDGALSLGPNINVQNNGLINTHEYTSYVTGNYAQSNNSVIGQYNVANTGGLFNIDVRSSLVPNMGTPLTTNLLATGVANPLVEGTDTLYYGSLNVAGTARFGTGNQFRVTGAYVPGSGVGTGTQITEASLNNVATAGAGYNYLKNVVVANTLNNTAQQVAAMQVTDNMLSVQFTAAIDNTLALGSDANAIDLVVTQTGMTTIGAAVLSNDLSSASGAAGLLDPLLKGPWLNDQQNNLSYGQGSYNGKNNFSLVQQYLYYVGNSSNTSQVGNKLQEVLPLITGGVGQVTQNTIRNLGNIIQSRQESQMGISSGDIFYGDKTAWFKPFGSWTNQDKRDGANGFDANTYGMAFGIDGELSETNNIGLAFTYARSDVTGKIADPTAKVNSYLLSAYGSHAIDDVTEITYQVGGGVNSIKGDRPIMGIVVAKSNYDSVNANASLGILRKMDLNENTKFIPSAHLSYTWTKDDGYSETGASDMSLKVGSNTREELQLSLDGKLTHPINDSILGAVNLGGGYNIIADRAVMTSSFIGDIPTFSNINFITEGVKPSRWVGRAGLGLTGNLNENLELSARYDLEIRDAYDNQTASLKLRYKFD